MANVRPTTHPFLSTWLLNAPLPFVMFQNYIARGLYHHKSGAPSKGVFVNKNYKVLKLDKSWVQENFTSKPWPSSGEIFY